MERASLTRPTVNKGTGSAYLISVIVLFARFACSHKRAPPDDGLSTPPALLTTASQARHAPLALLLTLGPAFAKTSKARYEPSNVTY